MPWLRSAIIRAAAVVAIACCVSCGAGLTTGLTAAVTPDDPIARQGRPLTQADVQEILARAPTFVGIDPEKYGLTVLPPSDRPGDRRVRITAPGLPFQIGRVELTVLRNVSGNEIATHQDTVTYVPIEPTAEVTLDLPDTLPPGRYTLEARLVLYGDVPGVVSGQIERIRRQPFVSIRGETTETNKVVTASVDDYDVSQSALSADQRRRLEEQLRDIARVDVVRVSITGHTCDLGTVEANAVIAKQRAQVAADELHKLGLHKEIEPQLFSGGSGKPDPTVGNIEQQRRKLRRIVVMVEYRLRKTP
jgi:outer membrane protein OmpA-like peptidoglycan-associated protein